MVSQKLNRPKVGFSDIKSDMCHTPKSIFFVLSNKTEICYLAQKIIYVCICRIMMRHKCKHDLTEHISVLMNKTKHMLAA